MISGTITLLNLLVALFSLGYIFERMCEASGGRGGQIFEKRSLLGQDVWARG